MPLQREWNLPIFDGRVRPPLMVNHYPGGRSCQGGVPSERGKLLDGFEHQGRLLTRRGGRGRISASTVGSQPTKNDRAKFRFQLNQDRITLSTIAGIPSKRSPPPFGFGIETRLTGWG